MGAGYFWPIAVMALVLADHNKADTVKKMIILTCFSITQIFLFIYLSSIFGQDGKFLIVSIAYFGETFFLLKFSTNQKERLMRMLILALPPFMIFFPIHLLSFNDTRVSLPGSVAHFYGILFGWLVFKFRSAYIQYSFLALFFLITLCFYAVGYPLWLNKINYNNYTGSVSETLKEYTLYNNGGQLFPQDTLKDRLSVFDFWDTACGVCIREFPVFQQKRHKYSKFRNVNFFAINVPLKSDQPNQAENLLKQNAMDFHSLYLSDTKELDTFKVSSFPTIMIVVNGEKVIYKGDIKGVDSYINKYLDRQLK